ncbi:hypothetical protein ACFQDN_26575 [Pseudomonas asuensis]|uniref:Uncharacterized protein n=1 Tax=Pseudomonas asuensis TaxID=1825787 RepID=A0ABQ2GXM4_9PSED|nr:hypothetical protein [Pseudomonas asuensis]GGM15972.1 hypothetical protein GCM10009425_28550 [Pseudomonas asuensis]
MRSLDILGTPAEQPLDRVTQLVTRLLQMPIAWVSLIDENRHWFKSKAEIGTLEMLKDIASCAHALEVEDLLLVEQGRH